MPLVVFACMGAATLFVSASSSAEPEGAADNGTAYHAIRVARAELGKQELSRLVEVTGHDGVPQPYVWKLTLKEGANSSKEIEVAGGKIVAKRTVPRPAGSSVPVRLTDLNLDSSGAFDAADAQSRKARVRFDSINYSLHANDAGKPVWTMELFNQDGANVGTMRLTATDGTIAAIDGRLATAPGRPGEPMTAASNSAAPSTVASSTTTVETTTVSAGAQAPPPPAVHDVDTTAVAPPPAEESEGGFFTRAGRTLDHTGDHVAHGIDTARDNVAHGIATASDKVANSIDTAHEKVDHAVRATGAKLEHFFGAHSDPD
jgi:hypothetical protein